MIAVAVADILIIYVNCFTFKKYYFLEGGVSVFLGGKDVVKLVPFKDH